MKQNKRMISISLSQFAFFKEQGHQNKKESKQKRILNTHKKKTLKKTHLPSFCSMKYVIVFVKLV